MKRLIKKAADKYTYQFTSPIIVNFGDDTSFKSYCTPLSKAYENEEIIKQAVDDSMNNLGPKGLAVYLNKRNAGLYGFVDSIIVTVKNKEAFTTVITNQELNNGQIDELKDYIIGQFGDGWGEGFEQQILDEYSVPCEEPNWDEENDDYSNETNEYKETISASFYDSKNWDLKQI